MTINERVAHAVFSAVDEINQQLSKEHQVEKSLDTVLFGESGNLDSLGLLSLLVAVEQEIETEFHVTINLTVDESAMSEEFSPFRVIGALTSHISEFLVANANV